MRLRIAGWALVSLLAPAALGVGTVTVTTADVGNGNTSYSLAWVSDAAGAVSGNSLTFKAGRILQVQFVPDGGGTAPTALYDVQLQDQYNVDILNDGTTAQGDNLSATASKVVKWTAPFWVDAAGAFELVVAAAGNAKGGQVIVTVGP